MNPQQHEKVKSARGFIAALDQSGGSTPKALSLYGIQPETYSGEQRMFELMHAMRTRIMTSPAFNGDRILGVILFEQTMDREIEARGSADYLWSVKQIVPFLKVDRGLAEEADGIGSVAVPVLLPALRRRHRAHARAHDLAVRQHDLEPRVRSEMVAVEAHRVADAVIHRVADQAAPAGVRRVDPHLEPALLDVAIKIDVRDARLDEREVALVVARENAVHALQVDRDAAAHVRRRAAVGEVLARRDRVERDLVLVRRANDRLNLLRRVGAYGRGRDQLVRLVLDVREVVAIRVQVVVAREHPVTPYGILFGRSNYLVAEELDAGTGPRNWRLDRIQDVEVTGRPGGKPEDFSLQAYADESFGIYQDDTHDVALRILPHGRDDAIRWRFHARQKLEEQADGSVIVRFRSSGMRELAWHLFTWQDKAEVLAPQALKDMLRDELEVARRTHVRI